MESLCWKQDTTITMHKKKHNQTKSYGIVL